MTWESGATTWFCESGFEEEFAWGKTTMMMRGKRREDQEELVLNEDRLRGREEILIARYYGPRYGVGGIVVR